MYFAYSQPFFGKGHRVVGSSASDSSSQKQQFDSDKHTGGSHTDRPPWRSSANTPHITAQPGQSQIPARSFFGGKAWDTYS